jgi:RNA polymerase sigma-70 factor (ECF subfamily)
VTEAEEAEYVRLLNDHQSMIRAFIISLMPGAPGVDDVIQEANRVLWTKRRDFEVGTNFRGWALSICRFQALAQLKKLRQQRWVSLSDSLAETIAGEMEDELDQAYEERRRDALRSCMAKLRHADRELLLERYWHRARLQDFAVMTGRSAGGLRVTLFRLRTALKRCIEQDLGTEGRA